MVLDHLLDDRGERLVGVVEHAVAGWRYFLADHRWQARQPRSIVRAWERNHEDWPTSSRNESMKLLGFDHSS